MCRLHAPERPRERGPGPEPRSHVPKGRWISRRRRSRAREVPQDLLRLGGVDPGGDDVAVLRVVEAAARAGPGGEAERALAPGAVAERRADEAVAPVGPVRRGLGRVDVALAGPPVGPPEAALDADEQVPAARV